MDYAGPLAKLAFGRDAEPEAASNQYSMRGDRKSVLLHEAPKKKHGRKALFGGKVADIKPHQRHMGSLLRDIAQISVRHPTLTRGFNKQLLALPKCRHMDERTLARDIAEALAWLENLLTWLVQKHLSREDWLDLVGIEPPTKNSKRVLREKALELLRKKLESQLNKK